MAPLAAHAASLSVMALMVRSPTRPCRAGISDTNLVAQSPLRTTALIPLRRVAGEPGARSPPLGPTYQIGGAHTYAAL